MQIKSVKINFEDARGIIMDILTHTNIQHVTFITSKKGAYRGDHYHKESGQYTYVLEGELKYVSKNQDVGKPEVVALGPGNLAFSPPNEAHGFLALKDSKILVLTYGPRGGDDFEKDTYRLPKEDSLQKFL